MSGFEVVRAYRDRSPRVKKPNWRKRAMIAGMTASAVAFGSIVVQANDSSSVYEVAKVYNTAKKAARQALPQVFYPAPRPVVATSLSYAPVFHELMPSSNLPHVGAKPVSGSPKAVKVAPKPGKSVRERDADFAESYLEARTSYCVRSCDGFFFPVGHPDSSGDLAAHDAACARACPASETQVYVAAAGSKGIEEAINRKGQRYDVLRTAFNHRTQYDSACTCTSASTPRNYSVMTDFTLRKGDLVMSAEGLKEFRGAERYPLRKADFGAASTSRMSAAELSKLQAAEVASMRGMGGDNLSQSLKNRIANTLKATRTRDIEVKGIDVAMRRVAGQDGRDLRYIGPDREIDRAR